MTLDQGRLGMTYSVTEMKLDEKTVLRLQLLGLTDRAEVVLLGKRRGGSVIVRIRGCRYAIGGTIARRLTVERKADEKE